MFLHKLFLPFALIVCLAVDARSQTIPEITMVPLTIEQGVPLQVVLDTNVPLKENETVRARVVEPVYAFDRVVIPAGAEVTGRITGFSKTGNWKRVSRMLGGDFTPVRVPEITFDKLVIDRCDPIAIETFVVPANDTLVLVDGAKAKSARNLKSTLKAKVPGSIKGSLGRLLWGLAPYHPQSLADHTVFKAVLLKPVHFGAAVLQPGALDQIGSLPPPESIAAARLITPLDSRTVRPGTPVEAVLAYPLFSEDDQLIYPVGSKLHGEVLEAKAARMRHKHGQLTFRFTTIEPPVLLTLPLRPAELIDGSFVSINVAGKMDDLRISEAGEARIKESKARFVAPAMAFVTVFRAVDATADPFGQALLGAYRSKFLKQFTGGKGSGFGLPASITGAMFPPVGLGLGIYGAARSVYKNFLGRGQDIRLPADTVIQLRLDAPLEQ